MTSVGMPTSSLMSPMSQNMQYASSMQGISPTSRMRPIFPTALSPVSPSIPQPNRYVPCGGRYEVSCGVVELPGSRKCVQLLVRQISNHMFGQHDGRQNHHDHHWSERIFWSLRRTWWASGCWVLPGELTQKPNECDGHAMVIALRDSLCIEQNFVQAGDASTANDWFWRGEEDFTLYPVSLITSLAQRVERADDLCLWLREAFVTSDHQFLCSTQRPQGGTTAVVAVIINGVVSCPASGIQHFCDSCWSGCCGQCWRLESCSV